jgi:hypothetical protein
MVAYAIECRRALHILYELDYGEGLVMWQAQRVFDLRAAYRPIDHPPYMVFHYMPLFHAASRLGEAVTGNLLWGGRLVSEAAGWLAGVVIPLWAFLALPRRLGTGVRLAGALAAAALYFATPSLWWTRTMRVDAQSMGLSVAGLFLYCLGFRRPWLKYAAMVLFVLAFFTKQTVVAAPVACLAAEWLADRRRAVRLAALGAILLAAGLSFLWIATDGIAFRHLFVYNQNPVQVKNLLAQMKINFTWSAIQIAAALGTFAYTLERFRGAGAVARLRSRLKTSRYHQTAIVACLYFILGFGVCLGTVKEGATNNYFLEWDVVCCLLGGLLVARMVARWRAAGAAGPELAAILAMPLLAVASGINMDTFRPPAPYDNPDGAFVRELIRSTPGPVYSENMVLLMQAGKEFQAEPAIVSSLARTGTWNEKPLIEWLRTGYFDLIVSATRLSNLSFYTPAAQAAIASRYELAFHRGPFLVYRRKGETPRGEGEMYGSSRP